MIQLLKLPIKELKEVAGESVVCLRCMGSEILPFADGNFELVLLPKLVHQNIRLVLFHEYQLTMINGVRRRVRDVCVRAFKNILEKVVDDKFCAGLVVLQQQLVPERLVGHMIMEYRILLQEQFATKLGLAILMRKEIIWRLMIIKELVICTCVPSLGCPGCCG